MTRFDLISEEIRTSLEDQASSFRENYAPLNVDKLKCLAKEEFGAKVVHTPLGLGSKCTRTEERIFIFYFATLKLYEPITLAHEIGHIAAGHLSDRMPQTRKEWWDGLPIRESEADYFLLKLLGISCVKREFYSMVESFCRIKDHSLNFLRHEVELQKLKEIGAYKAFRR